MLNMTSTLISLTVVEFVMALILILFWFSQTRTRGLGEMAAAVSVGGVGALVAGYGASVFSPQVLYIGFVCFIAAVLLACRSMRLLQGLRPRPALEAAALGAVVIAGYVLLVVEHRLSSSIAVNSAVHAIVCGLTARDLLRERHVGLKGGCRFLGILFALFALVQTARAIIHPMIGAEGALPRQIGAVDFVVVYVGMAVAISWSLGFLWASYRNAEFQLRAANRELEHFASAVAHDLKSPLNAVIGYLEAVEYLGPSGDAAQTARFIATAREAAMRMNIFIGGLLEQARASQLNPEIMEVDPKTCVREACANLEMQIDAAGATIKIGELMPVKANALQLTRVFQNLLDNAIKYSAEDRKLVITVSSEQRDGKVHFTVADNGVGISEADQKTIFAYFGRSESQAAVPGDGVGLSECRNILESFDGAIDVTSELGVGSTFNFDLPAAG